MGVKGLHAYLRKHGRLQAGKDIPKELHSYQPGVLYIDVCCEFFDLLNPLSEKLFHAANKGQDIDNSVDAIKSLDIVKDLADGILKRVRTLKDQAGLKRICLVFDGDKLKAKANTHAARSHARNKAFQRARRLVRRGLKTERQRQKFQKLTRAWVTFTKAMKLAVVEYLGKEELVKLYDPISSDSEQGIFMHQAPFEADSEIVFLCNQFQHDGRGGAIMSADGDLFAYGGNIDTPHVIKMNWETLKGTITNKRAILSTLNYRTDTEDALKMGQVWFSVLAATCGNDYAPNLPQRSFISISKAMDDLKNFDGSADQLLELVLAKLNAPESFALRFKVALHQYCHPLVTNFDAASPNKQQRSRLIPFMPDDSILPLVDGVHDVIIPNDARQDGSRYRVFNNDSFDGINVAEEQHSTPVVQPSSSNKKSTSKVKEGSRFVATMEAGLHSSVLSAAVARQKGDGDNRDRLAIHEADVLVASLRQLVHDVSYQRYVALHITNIAIRLAYKHLDHDIAETFFELFFLTKKAEQAKIWKYILCCGSDYLPERRGATQAVKEKYQHAQYKEETDLLDQRGNLRDGFDIGVFKAYDSDLSFIQLSHLMEGNVILRNVLLTARKMYFNGHHDPKIPASTHLVHMNNQIGVDLSTNFRLNIVLHFKQRYLQYLTWRLKQESRIPQGWPQHDSFLDALYSEIDKRLEKADLSSAKLGSAFDGVHLSANVTKQVVQFVNNTVKQIVATKAPFTPQLFELYLCRRCTTPQDWPTSANFLKYIFFKIWGVPFDERIQDDEDDEPYDQIQQEIAKLPPAIRTSIMRFIDKEKAVKAGKSSIADLDLGDCIGVKQERASIPKKRKRQEAFDEEDDGDDYYAQLADEDEDDEDEEDIGDSFFAGKPSRAKAAPLVSILMNILETYPDAMSFSICPVQPCHTISIPISNTFADTFLDHLDHFARHHMDTMKKTRSNSKDTKEQGRLDAAIKDSYDAIKRLKVEGKRRDPFDVIFDIKFSAYVSNKNGSIMRRTRHHARTLKERRPGYKSPRYEAKGIFRTDGIRLQALYTDWKRRRREGCYAKYLTEIRRTIPEKLAQHWNEDLDTGAINMLNNYAGTIGLDFGEVCSVASVFHPSDSMSKSSQLIIKRGFLYGNNIPNRNWLLNRKAANDIEVLECKLSVGSTRKDLQSYMVYIKALRDEEIGNQLFDFYSSTSVRRKDWDTAMSQRSRLDTACGLIMNQHKKTVTEADARKPVLFGFGLDGMRQKARKGAMASKDNKLANRLHARILQGGFHHCTRVCEYNTTKMCCHCVKSGNPSVTRYLQRPSPIGQQTSFRVLYCSRCRRVTHRDGNAGDNQATILRTMLATQKRPACFIPPSRRLI